MCRSQWMGKARPEIAQCFGCIWIKLSCVISSRRWEIHVSEKILDTFGFNQKQITDASWRDLFAVPFPNSNGIILCGWNEAGMNHGHITWKYAWPFLTEVIDFLPSGYTRKGNLAQVTFALINWWNDIWPVLFSGTHLQISSMLGRTSVFRSLISFGLEYKLTLNWAGKKTPADNFCMEILCGRGG